MIDRSIDHWWSGLAEIIRRHDAVAVEETGVRYRTSTLGEKVAALRALKGAVQEAAISSAGLAALYTAYDINLAEILDRDALNESELRRLAAHPLVEIGAHTTTHPHLSRLTASAARRELKSNKDWLEGLLDRPVRHFAYPFGGPSSCGRREVALARELGFRSAVTTRIGNLFAAHRHHLTALPRLRLFSEYRNLRLIDFQRNGAAGAFLTKFGKPAVTV
jgi:peptidoglycan/xylan/chitin deacetylase (PgdA/CDA1 family)